MSASRKVVVVTGASQGIGAEVVMAFRRLDCRVGATARSIGLVNNAGIYIGKPFTEHTADV
jgi:short-subunit dehydrogenase involved in D-alanine esterification of teichoic acids